MEWSKQIAFAVENGYNLLPLWEEQREKFLSFKTRPDDVYIVTIPRSGTTLTQEMTWLICHDFNFEMAKKFKLAERTPRLETDLYPSDMNDCKSLVVPRSDNSKSLESIPRNSDKSLLEIFADMPSPRIFKTHLPLSLLGDILQSGAKVIYVARDPKDQLVSMYRIVSTIDASAVGDFEDFWKKVKNNEMMLSPQWKHIKEAWSERDNPNVMIMFYEEMTTNLPEAIKKVAKFLNKPYTDEQVKMAADYLNIKNFRKNTMVNKSDDKYVGTVFVGAGKIGGYRDTISPEIEREIDEWIDENIRGTDIVFPTFKNYKKLSTKC